MRRFVLPLATLFAAATAAAAPLPKNVPVPVARPDAKTVVTPAAKTTVCSITINSADEIETFKASLPADRTNFVELTKLDDELEADETDRAEEEQEPTGRSGWLKKACQRKIKCDVLVISGHFGGSFFGSSGLDLSMETLEELSCDRGCDGILQNPKEVFLFGCNTLAGKKQDHRSPEEYRRVLREDGFSAEQAEQVVAFRYSPLGDAFSDRMRRVFRGAPRIYGFDSVGPSGRNVRGLLANYFKSIRGANYYLPENLRQLDESTNGKLAQALKVTAFAQERGAKEMRREQIPTCYLNNPQVPFTGKLNWIAGALRSEKSFAYLPAINDWLGRLTDQNYEWKDKEFEILEPVMGNTQLRDSLAGLVARRDSAILGMQLKVLTFMKFFGWVYNKDYMKRVEALLIGDLNQDFDVERKDQICSYAGNNSLKVDLSPEGIPAARFQDAEFVQTLFCVANFNSDLMVRAWSEYRKHAPGTALYDAYKSFLTSMRIPDNAERTLYATVLPQGDRLLDDHEEKVLCTSGYYGRHPLWRRPQLLSHLLTNPRYVHTAGCYVKFNKHIFGQLMDTAQRGPELRQAVISSFERQRTFTSELEVDGADQDRLMDLMDAATTDQRQSLAQVWSLVKNVTPTVQARLKAELYRRARAPYRPDSHTLENIVATALRGPVYCDFVLERAEIALEGGHWNNTLSLLDTSLSYCPRPSAPNAGDEELREPERGRVLRLAQRLIGVMGKLTGDAIANGIGEAGLMPIDLMSFIVDRKIPLQNLREAKALMEMNSYTYQGRMGHVSNDTQIMGLYPQDRLARDTRALLAGGPADREIAHRVLQAIDVGDDTLIPELVKRARAQGLQASETEPSWIHVLGRQDARIATEVWVELYAKLPAGHREWPPGFPTLNAIENSPLIPYLKERLRAKTIRDELAGEILQTYARSVETAWDFDRIRQTVRAFAQEFPRPKIQEAVRGALRIIQENQASCEEAPRSCSGGYAG